jgi:hypothetical protein
MDEQSFVPKLRTDKSTGKEIGVSRISDETPISINN